VSEILVHVGYHKSGHTWLKRVLFSDAAAGYSWLGHGPNHPVHRLVTERPLEFDPTELRRAFDPLLTRAEGAGLLPVLSHPTLTGHPYSGGREGKEIADRLRQVFPEARILVVIREQRSIIASTYKQYLEGGGVCSLSQFLEPSRRGRIPAFDYRHFEYHHLISYYHSLFGRDAVLVLTYEQFARDPRSFVAEIGEFAERLVPADVLDRLPYARRRQATTSALALAAVRRLNRFRPRSDVNPAPLVESRRIARLAKRIEKSKAFRKPAVRPLVERSEARLRSRIAEAVGDRYAESNRLTADLIGVDLASYGWPVSTGRTEVPSPVT
jgi:hypothetical protein